MKVRKHGVDKNVLDILDDLIQAEESIESIGLESCLDADFVKKVVLWRSAMGDAQLSMTEVEMARRQNRALLEELESHPKTRDSLVAVLPKLRHHQARVWGPATKNQERIDDSGFERDIFITNVVGDLLTDMVSSPLKILITDRIFDIAAVDWVGHENFFESRVFVYSNLGSYIVAVVTEEDFKDAHLAAPPSTNPEQTMLKDHSGTTSRTKILLENTSYEESKSPEFGETQKNLEDMERYLQDCQGHYDRLKNKTLTVSTAFRRYGENIIRLKGAYLLHKMLRESSPRAPSFEKWTSMESIHAVAKQMNDAMVKRLDKPGVDKMYEDFRSIIENHFSDLNSFKKILEN
jgi:hypothetical protein